MAAEHPPDTFHHVRDYPYFELLGGERLDLPNIAGLQLTRFMVLQLVAFALAFIIFVGLARHIRNGSPAKGRWWNFWEMLLVYIRDAVVRPTIGDPHHNHDDADHARHGDFAEGGESIHTAHAVSHAADHTAPHAHAVEYGHPADKYLPFVWSCFIYVLFCNLLGAIPFLGSPTGEINVTAMLALSAFIMTLYVGTKEMGFVGFWKNLVPGMDLPGPTKILLVPMIWAIEVVGLLVKHGVLAVRLFANIMAGHTVVAVILGFIGVAEGWLFYLIAPASVFGQVGIGLLELFVAFLQAYIFAFLTTLFIGTAVHPH